MRGKPGEGNSIEIDRERHYLHLVLGCIRMVLIFDYILQAHSGGVRAISSLKRPNHRTRDPGRILTCLIGNPYCPYQWDERALEWHEKRNFKSAAPSIFEPDSLLNLSLLNQVLDTERS